MVNDSERVQTLNDIITGIARRSCHKFKGLSVEDISQSLWLKVLEVENKLNYSLDLNFVARICYDYIVDLQRYEMKRNSYSLESIVESPEWSHSPSDDITVEDELVVNELLSVFPEESPEGIFLRYWLTAADVKDFGYEPSTSQGRYTENEIAQILGFNNSSHRGYRRLRHVVREVVLKYFGFSD